MEGVERQAIQVAIESVYDFHMHAGLSLHSPPVRCMVAQALCSVGGVITVTENIFLHHILCEENSDK